MAADAVQFTDLCPHFDLFTKEFYFICPFNDRSSQCSDCLISDKKDGAFRSPEVMLQMMLDPSGLTHTTGRKDHLRIRVEVDVLGILTGN